MRAIRGVAAIVVAISLQGCADLKWEWMDRYGPAPVPSAAAVTESVQREMLIVQALARSSGYANADGYQQLPGYGDRRAWADIVLSGFNTVDDACTAYINDLWKADRQKNRVKDILAVTSAAVAGIVGARTHAPGHTLTIIAEAFGLGSHLSNAVFESYLFSQSAATIRGLVKKSTGAYRDDFGKHIRENDETYPMGSAAAAYFHLREYLSLCLPPTIQSQIDEYLAAAKAAPEGTGTRGADGSAGSRSAARNGGAPRASSTNIVLTPR